MLCDNETCRKRGINCFDSSGSKLVPDSEFCLQLRHIKCKVAELARKQIQQKILVPNYRTAALLHQPQNFNPINTRMAGVSRGTTYSNSRGNINAWGHEDKGTQSNVDSEKAKSPVDINDKKSNVEKGQDRRFIGGKNPDKKLNMDKDRGRTFIVEKDRGETFIVEKDRGETFIVEKDPDKILNVEKDRDGNFNNVEKLPDNNLLAPEQPALIPKHPKPAPGYANVVLGAKVLTHWIKCISRYFTKQFKVMLVAIIIGILMWMALVYGAILGASLCTNGQLPSFQFGSSHPRATVF